MRLNRLMTLVRSKKTDFAVVKVHHRWILTFFCFFVQRMSKICTTLAGLQINSKKVIAEQLLLNSNAELRVDAKEWMKRTAEN